MDSKRVFVAFAIEDKFLRTAMNAHSQLPNCPYEYVDYSVKDPYDSGWKEKVRSRIKSCKGVVAIISKNSVRSEGQQWEIACAISEGKPVLYLQGYSDDFTTVGGKAPARWTWDNIAAWIRSI